MENKVQVESLAKAVPLELAQKIVQILDSKKAKDIKLLYVENQTIIADYFVICGGTSNTQIKSLANEVEYQLNLCEVDPKHVEGYQDGTWILLDYCSVLVHIFNRETRDFYKLEKLWNDATEIDITNLLNKN